MGMNLPTSGSGGGFNGSLGGIASGLTGLLQGFMQGRQFKMQQQQQQQEISGERLRNGLSLYQLISQIGQASPEALKSPGLQQFIKSQGPNAIPLPTDAQGNIDVNAFRKPINEFTQGAEFEKFLSLPKGSPARAQMLSGYGGTDDQKQQLVGLDQQLSPAERDNANTQMRYLRDLVTTQGLDPDKSPGWQQQWNYYAQLTGQPQYTPGMFQQSAKTQAGIDETQAKTEKTKAQTQGILQTNYYRPLLNNARIENWHAMTNKANVEAWAIPQRVAIQSRNAASAAERADDNHQKLGMDLKAFQQLGTTPQALSAYNGLTARIQNQVNLDKTALTNVRTGIDAILKTTNGAAPPKGSFAEAQLEFLSKEQKRLQARYDNSVKAYDAFAKGRGQFAQQVLHRQGAPGSWQLPKDAQPAFGADAPVAPGDGTMPLPRSAAPPAAAPPTANPDGKKYSPDGTQYWLKGVIYDAATGKPVLGQ